MSLTFFAKKPWRVGKSKRLMRASSLIRAEQIAEYLGAKLNPIDGFENDVCISVKPVTVGKDGYIVREPKDGEIKKDWLKENPEMAGIVSPVFGTSKFFIDIIDGHCIASFLEYPEMPYIVASKYCYDYMANKIPNRIVLIPQQHCNFERLTRIKKEITTVGITGSPITFQYPMDKMRKMLEEKGLFLVDDMNYNTREDVVNFYKKIDIQIVWDTRNGPFKNPLKIINAASFGVPTVGYPCDGYEEVEGYYTRAETIDELFGEVEKLKNQDKYEVATKGLSQFADNYHISKIAEMYKKLEA